MKRTMKIVPLPQMCPRDAKTESGFSLLKGGKGTATTFFRIKERSGGADYALFTPVQTAVLRLRYRQSHLFFLSLNTGPSKQQTEAKRDIRGVSTLWTSRTSNATAHGQARACSVFLESAIEWIVVKIRPILHTPGYSNTTARKVFNQERLIMYSRVVCMSALLA